MNFCFMRRHWISPLGEKRAWGNMCDLYKITDPEWWTQDYDSQHSTAQGVTGVGDGLQGDASHTFVTRSSSAWLCGGSHQNFAGRGKEIAYFVSQAGTSWAVLGQMGVLGQQLTKPVWSVLCGCGKYSEQKFLGKEPPNFAVLMWKPVLEAKHV